MKTLTLTLTLTQPGRGQGGVQAAQVALLLNRRRETRRAPTRTRQEAHPEDNTGARRTRRRWRSGRSVQFVDLVAEWC